MTPGSANALLAEALVWARAQWPTAVLIPELSVATWGGARLDLAVCTPEELIGIEIKGDGDSHARLSLQGMVYSSVCSRMFLLTSDKLRASCLKAKPPGWLMARDSERKWWSAADERGEYQAGYGYDGRVLPTSPIALLGILWAGEIKQALDFTGVFVPQKTGAAAKLKALANEVPLKTLQPMVYWMLHRRQWEKARFGSKLIYRPENVPAARAR